MTYRFDIPVPGRFEMGPAFIDLETVKVPAATPPADGYRMPNGQLLRKRWSVTMAGVARDGWISVIDGGSVPLLSEGGTEGELLETIGDALDGATEVRYSGTREFDEMICKGRFTNARRAHLPAPAFPAVPFADERPWVNIRKSGRWNWVESIPRGEDVASRDVPEALARGEWEKVAVHLLRDVVELILAGGAPDTECRDWCVKVMADFRFALREIYERDE